MIGKLLVVDDEVWFREGLTKLIADNQLGWEVVGEASDGEEALAAIDSFEPDLILTDINMPVLDGLALAEQIHLKGNNDPMVIILTGYRDFEYAQQALRYGAIEFLLKPFSLDEMKMVLHKAYEKFRRKELLKRVKRQELQSHAMRSAILRLPYNREEWRSLGIDWRGYSFELLQIHHFFPKDKSYSERDIGLLHYAVSNIIAELQQECGIKGGWLPLTSHQFAFVLEPGPAVEAYRQVVGNTVEQLLGISVHWQCAGTIAELEDLSALYDSIAIQGHPGSQTVWLNETSVQNESYELREAIVSSLMIGDLQGAKSKIESYLNSVSSYSLQQCKAEIYKLIAAFSDILMTDFKHLKEASYEDLNPSAILLMNDNKELLEWALCKSNDFLGLFERWMQEKRDNVVVRAIQYIDLHYREVCTLQVVAAHVHVTPNYLSNLFKKETGTGFTNYISSLRVDKAKALLRGTKLKMTEIAEQTGFDNSSYFTAVFKQLMRMSPSDYRKEQA